MKGMAIVNGDIRLSTSRRMDFVSGRDKLFRDLTHWLAEPLGLGVTTPSFGSSLPNYVGDQDPEVCAATIRAEVARVIGLYQAWQYERLRRAKRAGTLGAWSKSEVVREVSDISTIIRYDRIIVKVTLSTLAGNDLSTEFSVALGDDLS